VVVRSPVLALFALGLGALGRRAAGWIAVALALVVLIPEVLLFIYLVATKPLD
jgi:hypothetical protein